jgi:uncharacterized membrane protein
MQDQQSKTIIVKGNLDTIFQHWANFENFPRFMRHITSVSRTGDKTSHWCMEGALGKNLEWDAETTRFEENTRIAWKSTGGDLKTSGQVTFTDLKNGEVQVTFSQHYELPAGMAGQAYASFFDNPDERLAELLRDFKAYAEGSPLMKDKERAA